jgi:hypothetical protein
MYASSGSLPDWSREVRQEYIGKAKDLLMYKYGLTGKFNAFLTSLWIDPKKYLATIHPNKNLTWFFKFAILQTVTWPNSSQQYTSYLQLS